MDAPNRPLLLRVTVFFALCILHIGLSFIFLRNERAHEDESVPPETHTTILFPDLQPRLAFSSPDTSKVSHRPITPPHPQPNLPTAAPGKTAGPKPPASEPEPPPSIDWSSEAQHTASEITSRSPGSRNDMTPSSHPAPPPWDLRPLFHANGHGLEVLIPVEIPGTIIDHCFGDLDPGHDQTGQGLTLQLKCAFGKIPARGDLFDSLRATPKPPE